MPEFQIHWWNRIRVRVLLFGVVMSILPVVLVSTYYLHYAKLDLQESIQNKNRLFVNYMANEIDSQLQQTEDRLKDTGFFLLSNQTKYDQTVQLYRLLNQMPMVDKVVIFDQNGKVSNAVDRFNVILNPDELNWTESGMLAALRNHNTFYSSVHFMQTGIPLIEIIVPRYSADGLTFLGGLGVEIRLRTLFDLVNTKQFGNKVTVYLVDNTGQLIAHNDFIRVLEKTDVTESFSVQHFLHNGNPDQLPVPNRYLTYSGQEVLGVYDIISKTGWGVIAEQPVSVAFASINTLWGKIIWFLLVIVSLSVMISIYYGLDFTRPIEYLERVVRKVGGGNLEAGITLKRNDELEHLAISFNSMIEKLRIQAESLLQEKDRLDTIVKGIGAGLALIKNDGSVAWLNSVLKEWLGKATINNDMDLIEYLNQHRNDQVFRHQIYQLLHVRAGEPERLMLVEDITEQRKMEEIVIQADKLSALGSMASGFAHEINNPLSSIQGYAEDLEERLQSGEKELLSSGVIQHYLQIIQKNAHRAKRITENLLNFSRKSEWKEEWIDVYDILEESLSLLKHSLEKKQVKVDKECEKPLPRIKGDALQLMQVIVNLLNNSLDAIPIAGQIKIQAFREADAIIIKIWDNGTGISKQDLNDIFNPFFTTKQAGKGTGLGLSICYGIITRMGGTICLESEDGNGTEAVLTLPVKEEQND